MKPDISAFIIAYNDRESIATVIDGLISVLGEVARFYEIIIVLYEGTSDGTEKIARNHAEKDPCVSLVWQPLEKKGYGVALRLGIEKSCYELVFYTDGDNQFDVHELPRFVEEIKNADIVTGNRVKRKDPPLRLFTAAVYNRLMNILFHTRVRDVDSAFKLYRREFLDRIKITCATGLADAEILAKARRLGARIVELPVSHRARAHGKPVFELASLRHLGIIHPRVVRDLIREMKMLLKEMHCHKGNSI